MGDSNKSIILAVDGIIEYRKLTSEYVEEAIKLLEEIFCKEENVSRAIHLGENEAALAELVVLPFFAAQDGISIIAVDNTTRKVVATLMNKIQTKESLAAGEEFLKQCKEPQALAGMEFVAKVNAACNLFEHCQVDCIFETMYLATDSAYRGRGIAKKLVQLSVETAKQLAAGVNVKHSIDDSDLALGPKPQLVSGIFTSFISQKIGKQLGFEIGAEIKYNECFFNGEPFSSVIGEETPSALLAYLKL